ncbi:MAG TPA: type VI secretion system tip protein TssI/VgrG, partial [Polyangiaceae bacterium]|nr:type VI secretion system tip protein TssI/VgrG [Polyangiaceae bacterium]
MSQTRLVNVVTPLGDELLFLSMSGREALGSPFCYEVELLSESSKVDLSALLGQTITLELELEDGGVREFNGVVTYFSAMGAHGRYALYRATVRPWLALLGNRRNSRIFQDKTVPEVVKEIFRDHGFSDFVESLGPGYEPRTYLVQYRESDLNFVNRILEEEGIYYFFKHQDRKTVLVLADSYSAHEPVPGSETLPYFPPQQREHRERDHIDGWTVFRQIRSGKVELADFDFEKPAVKLRSNTAMPAEHPHGDAEIYDYPGRFTQRAGGDRLSRLQMEEHLTDQEVAQASGNARAIYSGALFTLQDFPREDQNKEYLVVEYSVELRDNSYESGQARDTETEYRCRFTAIESKRPYHPPRVTPKPIVEGPQTAIVVGQEGKEIWTDNYGRVKLKFHWDRKEQADQTSSCWVRVAQLWAGSGFGGIHLPRIGQEVIVDFL